MSTEKKADFSGVTGSVDSTAEQVPKADFSGVSASVDSTAEVVDATYTVEKGDTLSKIAKQHLGDANAWNRIFEANRDQLDDPDRIQPGQVLKLPSK
ncbi:MULTISPECIES: LysM peptidoglycan-binding domain-containing protein [unclassified Stenotrophomonas]|jgi:nucleoid-associated protein YgaU|uniref:LysM peptidoglycan-binding domain-containing protein n=1 Tax=unclassified Stenotrophomonas TaxID=196198 RepID=UPI0005AEF9A1|nr:MULTISPECIES: LysM peptidoglycan-binding domain-containing protein [unclassified Stenotrophomonas]KIP80455.1 peptidoglycan-binding protein LysM [Stenotrophomonas maltophilia]MBD8645264.1 LysM peptidoglycan-binding domain-containing protein [Stenotrophomonas sp. CFBP 13724]MDY1032381.1 LysM peptidoglycan-binding domain-containing protein [Stenotrophomonas sp. CFBP8980]